MVLSRPAFVTTRKWRTIISHRTTILLLVFFASFAIGCPKGSESDPGATETATTMGDCACLMDYMGDSSHRILSQPLMDGIAKRFGGEEATALFNPERDYGGPYGFQWTIGRVSTESDGFTMEQPVKSIAALSLFISREEIEDSDEIMEDHDLEPGNVDLVKFAREPLGPHGKSEYEEIEGLADYAAFHTEYQLLMVACGDALMQIEADVNKAGLTDLSEFDEDELELLYPDKVEKTDVRSVTVALAEALVEDCDR